MIPKVHTLSTGEYRNRGPLGFCDILRKLSLGCVHTRTTERSSDLSLSRHCKLISSYHWWFVLLRSSLWPCSPHSTALAQKSHGNILQTRFSTPSTLMQCKTKFLISSHRNNVRKNQFCCHC